MFMFIYIQGAPAGGALRPRRAARAHACSAASSMILVIVCIYIYI